MKVEQIYTGCLAEAAYYIESKGEAVIIDPLRETEPYLERLEESGAKLKYVLETHFHADFVSGHLDLREKTGAEIVYGPTAKPGFDAHIAEDGEVLKVGDVEIKVLHTPGHTMESSTFLLSDEEGKPYAIFTGDTLFIGDVGRPDLAVKTDLTQEDLASHLYDSLRNKIMPLPDDIIVYPGHGAGSACGKNMSKETYDSLGHQKEVNYALKEEMTKEEFIKEVTEGLVKPPQYFPKNAVMNKTGYDSIDDVLDRGVKPMKLEEFEERIEDDRVLLLDTRKNTEFPKAYVPGSIFVGIDDNFATWVGTLIEDLDQPIVFIADPGREKEVVTRLARVGYDNAVGYLDGGIGAWLDAEKPTWSFDEVSASQLEESFESLDGEILDVRKKSEYDSEHIQGVKNFPLDFINESLRSLDKNKKYYVHCAGGYRSVITCSIMKANGFHEVVNVKGGFNALKTTALPKTAYKEPETML